MNTTLQKDLLPLPTLPARRPVALWDGRQLVSITRGDTIGKEIALTLDDGPHPPFTERLLALLQQLHVHATFFVVGWKVDQAPWVLRRMLRDGDEIGNHTYHHFDLKLAPWELTASEVRLDNDAIERACGVRPVFFRPSGGQYDPQVLRAAAELHMTTVLWTDDPADYLSPGENVILNRLFRHISPGAIVLLHDGIQQTYDILPYFVARMRQEGYTFVTMSELVKHLEATRNERR